MRTPLEYLEDIENALQDGSQSTWNRNFLKSIQKLLHKDSTLTERQVVVLDRILYSLNEDRNQFKYEKWKNLYISQYRSDAITVAHYHSVKPYYTLMASDILEGHIPDKKAFFRMFNNKYSQKVLQESQRKPKFIVGDLVVLKSSFKPHNLKTANGHTPLRQSLTVNGEPTPYAKLHSMGGIIVEIDDKIFSSAKGAKRYKIVPMGGVEVFYIEERYLMPHK